MTLSLPIIGESQGTGVGTGALAGAAGLAGAAAAGLSAGAAAAGFGGAHTAGVAGAAGFSLAGLVSDCTDPPAPAFTPSGTEGLSAVGFASPSGEGEAGGLVSSGMYENAQTSGSEAYGENVNFYQLESVSVNEGSGEVVS